MAGLRGRDCKLAPGVHVCADHAKRRTTPGRIGTIRTQIAQRRVLRAICAICRVVAAGSVFAGLAIRGLFRAAGGSGSAAVLFLACKDAASVRGATGKREGKAGAGEGEQCFHDGVWFRVGESHQRRRGIISPHADKDDYPYAAATSNAQKLGKQGAEPV